MATGNITEKVVAEGVSKWMPVLWGFLLKCGAANQIFTICKNRVGLPSLVDYQTRHGVSIPYRTAYRLAMRLYKHKIILRLVDKETELNSPARIYAVSRDYLNFIAFRNEGFKKYQDYCENLKQGGR